MSTSWRYSPAWLFVLLIAGIFVVGVTVPLEIASYSSGHQKVPVDESLENSFRIAYIGQWSGYGNHWYNYTVTFAAPGLNWSDLWMTVFFNGTTTPIESETAHAVVNNGTVAYFNFLNGNWRGGSALVRVGETLSIDTAEFGGDGNTLYVVAISGYFSGSFSLVIP
ncbi:MAG: hypothetical protein WA688_00445 [Thermoplasmata archaeon]